MRRLKILPRGSSSPPNCLYMRIIFLFGAILIANQNPDYAMTDLKQDFMFKEFLLAICLSHFSGLA